MSQVTKMRLSAAVSAITLATARARSAAASAIDAGAPTAAEAEAIASTARMEPYPLYSAPLKKTSMMSSPANISRPPVGS